MCVPLLFYGNCVSERLNDVNRYGNYITSFVLVFQLIFLTASFVRFHQYFPLAIGLPESKALAEDFTDSDIAFICIDAYQNTYVTFSSKKDMQTVTKHYSTCYNNSTIRIGDHDELSALVREIRGECRQTQIVIAANRTLRAPVIMQLFSTLCNAHFYKCRLLTTW